MHRAAAKYLLLIAVIAAAFLYFGGAENVTPGRIVLGSISAILFAYLMWLRWDWAPAQGRRRRAEREKRGK